MTDNYGSLIDSNRLCSPEQWEHVKRNCKRAGLPEPKKHLTVYEFRNFMAAINKRRV